MKNFYFLVIAAFVFSSVQAQFINIPDANLKTALISSADFNGDFEIDAWEASITQDITIANLEITDFEGLQYFTNLHYLDCSENHSVVNFDLIYSLPLTELRCSDMGLTSLNLSNFPNLYYLYCDKNHLTTIDASGLSQLRNFTCAENQLTAISLAGDALLEYFNCNNNMLSTIDFTGLSALKQLVCSRNNLTNQNGISSINSTALEYVECSNNQLSGNFSLLNSPNLKSLDCANNLLTDISLSPGANLLSLNCANNMFASLNLAPYTSIKLLQCNNNQLTSLQVYSPVIETLDFKSNSITSVTLAGTGLLQDVFASFNQLSELDLTGAVNLHKLYIDHNNFTQYNSVMPNSAWTELSYFDCSYNNLTTVDVSQNVINYFYCGHNLLTEIIQNPSQHIEIFDARSNLFTEFILRCHTGTAFLLNDNPLLEFINLKDGDCGYAAGVYFENCPNLRYICVKDAYYQEMNIQNKINLYGYTNCHVNTYCSFNPGGTYNVIGGNQKYDLDGNGCDNADLPINSVRFNVVGGISSGTTISGIVGDYSIPVANGSYTITPTVENPAYFNVSPTSFTADFPTEASPLVQNICVSPTGIHHDLEVTIVPTSRARPGFDATYKIVYKNKGTQIESGLINLNFDDAVLDLTVSNPIISSQSTNVLQWNFINLMPFENREIVFTLNVNSPIETPPVANGSILNFTVSVNSDATDETPENNECILNQTVTNSIDPNDKTCLEGTTITPDMAGKEVHYMIRFENTGTANAENIVVKDMIDTSKFDINSLVPLDGSAPFITRISNTNKVEFIFENINLPFDDANNDGYVAFKIKTKPTLVSGDTFSNTASIYFDYNFPVVTNTATTTIAVLAKQDFNFENYFKIYPNPANNVLNIESKKQIEVTSVSIYNTLGQLVLVVPNAKDIKTVDVSALKSGNYFIKILSDKGSSNIKFIKQ
jgi:hypothetical protein